MATLGALNSQGPATAGVLNGGDVPTGALDAAAQSGAGVSAEWRRGGLNLGGGGGGVIRPGWRAAVSERSARPRRGPRAARARPLSCQGPKGNANVGGAEVSRRQRLQRRPRRGRHEGRFPRLLQPRPRRAIRICRARCASPPRSARTARCCPPTPSGGGGSRATRSSAASSAVFRARQFSPPEGGGATVVIPVTFALQK